MSRRPLTPADVIALDGVRARRTLAAAQNALLPGTSEVLAPEELARRVAARLASLPAEEKALLRRKMLVAVHGLSGLVDALTRQMNSVAGHLRAVSNHSSAANAYGRTAGRAADSRS